jgi:predicted component of type VI protein secretion system
VTLTIGRRDLVVERLEGEAPRAVTYDVSVRQCREDGRHVGVTELFPLEGVLRIGGDATNDIVLDGRRVEPFHATIERTARGLQLTLLGEAEATVGDRLLRGAWGLLPGDALGIGDYRLTVDASVQDGDSAVDWNLVSPDGQASLQLIQAVSLGRDDACDLKMIDDEVSPLHASLIPIGGTLWIRDLSGGATFVNDDQVVGGVQLRDRDVLRMGPTVAFRIVERRRPEAATARVPMPPLAAEPRVADRSNPVQMDALGPDEPPRRDRRPSGARCVRADRVVFGLIAHCRSRYWIRPSLRLRSAAKRQRSRPR